MGNYISRTMNYSNKVVGIVETYKDVRATYKTNNMPKDLSIEWKNAEVKTQIQNHCIKMCITKEMEMVNSIESMHANIWVQCTDPLQNMINHLDGFTMKEKYKDVIFLHKNLKTVSTWIEFLGNKRVNYFNALKYFVNLREGPSELDDVYIKRARLAIETSILAVGRHVLCIPDIMEAVGQEKPLEK